VNPAVQRNQPRTGLPHRPDQPVVLVHKFITAARWKRKIDRMIRGESRLAEDIIGSGRGVLVGSRDPNSGFLVARND